MLAAPGPVSIMWGPDRVQLYNDAYISVAGDRHPAALGRPVSETWAEAYDPFLGPVLDRAYAGEAVALEEKAVLLRGANGELEERVFSATFSPVWDDAGRVAGVFHPLVEVTRRVAAERELKAEQDRSRAVLDNLGEGFVVLDHQFRVLEINAEGLRLDGRRREAIVGRSHWEAFPASVGTPVEAAYRRALNRCRSS
jgi:PAS domain-containing protein